MIERDQIAKLAENVSCYFDHVLMASRSLQRFEGNLRGVTLHIAAIDHHLYDSVPHLRTRPACTREQGESIVLLRKRNHRRFESVSASRPDTTCNRRRTSH